MMDHFKVVQFNRAFCVCTIASNGRYIKQKWISRECWEAMGWKGF